MEENSRRWKVPRFQGPSEKFMFLKSSK